jgi:N-methylhydantoinase A
LGIPRVLAPTHPGILSALGVAVADVVKDYSRTVMLRGNDLERRRLEEEFHGMEGQARAELQGEGLPSNEMTARRFLDVRYVGQSFELTIDCPNLVPTLRGRRPLDLHRTIGNNFYRAHLQRFGYADRGEPVEVVNLRLKLELAVEKPKVDPQPLGDADASAALVGREPVVFPQGSLSSNLYDRDRLKPGNRIAGPALLLQLDTTIVAPPGWDGAVDPYGNLVLTSTG